jgi:hypothetical protein
LLRGGAGWNIQQSFGGSWQVLERGYLEEPDEVMERKEFYMAMSDPVNGFYTAQIVESHESLEPNRT